MASKLQQNFVAIGGRILVIVFLVLSLILVTIYFREGENGPLHTVQNAVSGLTVPFKFVSGAMGAGVDAAGTALDDATASASTLDALKAQNEELREEIAQLEEYRQEVGRLEDLLNMKNNYALETIGARIISRSPNAYEQVVTIDKGESDGVITGLPIMGQSGVIGQVISADAHSAEVRLLADPQSGVAVLIQSNRAEGIVHGSLEGLLYLENVNADAAVQVGDVVVTSGLGGSYFRGLMIGMVVKVDENQGGSTRKIVVAPNSSASPLEEVLVVLKMNSEGDATIPTAPANTDQNTQTNNEGSNEDNSEGEEA